MTVLRHLIIPLFLFEKEILTRPCFYLSAYFESRREEYIARLRELGRRGSWTRWCRFFVEGVAVQAGDNTRKARAVHDLHERLERRVIDLTHSPFAVPLLDFIFERPMFRSSDLTKLEHMPSAPMISTLPGKLRQQKQLTGGASGPTGGSLSGPLG
ncbi:MAG: hypothetical protein H7A46_25970 [Verrucomicrobiales bacterium]|nr:hypothetical protein [Verrucomicrobiales bacterium]